MTKKQIIDAEIITTNTNDSQLTTINNDSDNLIDAIATQLADTFLEKIQAQDLNVSNEEVINRVAEVFLQKVQQQQKLTEAATDDEIINEWLAAKGKRSPHTLKNYRDRFAQFRRWFPFPLHQITPKMLNNYLSWLIWNYSPNTTSTRFNTIKSFFTYAHKMGYLPNNPTTMMTTEKPESVMEQRLVTKEEVGQFFSVIDDAQYSLLFRLIASNGLRISEAINIQWDDVFFILGKPVLKVKGKGSKTRYVPVFKELLNEAKEMKSHNKYMFSFEGKKLNYQTTYKKFKKYVNLAKINYHCSAHWLRHFFATEALKAGALLKEVQQQLGHASIDTTAQYQELIKGEYAGDKLDKTFFFNK